MNATAMQASYEDARPFCPTPLIGGGAQKPKPEPVKVVATPYVWRDPTTIRPREWVYGRSIQRGHVRAILAPGAAGKTILSVGEALAMATGRNLLGQEVPGGPKRVWLWNLEDDAEELARIIQAACKHWSIGPEHIRDHLFVDSALEGAILKLATSTAAEGLVINRPLVAGLTDELLDRGVDYLHADPFVSSHSANENDNMEIDSIAKEWAMVAKNAKCGIGLAHHVSKAGAAEVTALSGRGAVALINACRSVLVLNRMGEEEARMWGIEGERRRRFFRVYDDKNNRAPPSDKSDWYTMASVSLGNGVNDDGDNMGVVIPWSPPDAFEGVTADHLLTVQHAIDRVANAQRYRADAQAKAWVGKVVADVFGLSADSSVKADRARINKMLGTWFATGALVKVDGKDDKSNDRTFVEVGTWALQDVRPTSSGEVRTGGEGGGPNRPHPTCPPIGAGVGKGGPRVECEGGENTGGEAEAAPRTPTVFPAGNPALRSILAPSETGKEPIPGYEDFE
ncbi:AAA family ATPase [Sphingomonas sp. PB2P19]|uniref:AAA family ATPase n=1 Tax=Sphingomonas rhamnosi TaxID=3096156 RepID=UPI002FCA72BB